MSDTEVKSVVGTNGGITEKDNGWYEIQVKVPGKEYPVKLATKKKELVEGVRALASGEVATFSFKETESDRINPHTDKPYINRYFEGVEAGGTLAASSSGGGGHREDVDWDSKERRDYRSRSWAHTISAFQHTIKVDEDPMLVFGRLHSFQQAIYNDIVRELAEGAPAQQTLPNVPAANPDEPPHDDDDIPF